MEKAYYERYWARKIRGGVAEHPPHWNQKDLDRIMALVKPYAHGKVLDVGCGEGFFTNAVNSLSDVEECFGIDISETAIHLATSEYPHIDFRVGSVADLPFESNYFDLLCAIELVEHILDVQQMFKEFNRVLKKDQGTLIITTTDFNILKRVLISLFFFERYFYPTNPHIRFFTKGTLMEVLKRNGFEIVAHKWNGAYLGVMPKGQIMVARKIRDILP